jgi:hypothetical protein
MDTEKKNNRKIVGIALLCLCIVALFVGSVIAYLTARTEPVTNEFVPAKVTCIVEEVFENGVKNDVKIRNTGNVDAYIRAAILVNWVDDEGNYIPTPEGCSYTITPPEGNWQQSGEYYYYSGKVVPGGSTTQLIPYAAPVGSAPGCHLKVDVMADAIQAEPVSAVINSWGWTPPAVG